MKTGLGASAGSPSTYLWRENYRLKLHGNYRKSANEIIPRTRVVLKVTVFRPF